LAAADRPAFDVVSAFKHLSGPDAVYPNGLGTPDDQRALRVLHDHPQEVKPLFVAMMSKEGHRGRTQVQWMISLMPKGDVLAAGRQIIATYPVGDPSTPLLGLLITTGEAQDMNRLKEEIAFAPDSEQSIEWAKVMTGAENPLVHKALQELQRTVPGKWQESRELVAFFGKSPPAQIPSRSETSHLGWWILGAVAVAATAFVVKARR
jgi:hypothetical protein